VTFGTPLKKIAPSTVCSPHIKHDKCRQAMRTLLENAISI
jgi:hypothetical protein